MKRLAAVVLAALHLAVLPGLAGAQGLPPAGESKGGDSQPAAARDFKAEAKLLAQQIDRLIEKSWKGTDIKPAPRSIDTQFLRRLHLDLSGRIPELTAVRDFLDDDRPNKRELRIEELLASENFTRHFAAYWRAVMLQGTNNTMFQGLEPGFEAWLRAKLQNNTRYDQLVRELLLTNAGGFNRGFNPGQPGGNPQAFFLANENKPENLAGATARVFLGVKLECAQCHPHPFAKWKRSQFWEYAAFFSGMQQFNPRRGPGGFNPNSREIKIPNTDTVVKAKFLSGGEPKWPDNNTPTIKVLADWMTTAENPYFARAAVDHVWNYFFGVSLLEPILEPTPDSPPAHPELLDTLAKEFAAHNFDLKFLIRAIVLTDAYSRSSGTLSNHKHEIELFARMPVRGLSPEQFFDSLTEATDYQDPYRDNPQMQIQQFNGGPQTPRALFLSKFTSQDRRTESHTSILQALFMMNGKFLAERTKLENNKSLFTIATAPTPTERRVETLYLLVLSRLPRPDETKRLVEYIENGGATRRWSRGYANVSAGAFNVGAVVRGEEGHAQAVADVYWALLNSGEFMLNH
jgi:hypothetical protein